MSLPSRPSSAVVERVRALLRPAPPDVETTTVGEVLQRGRYDPGRRGAVALCCLGVVAALVAGLVLLRGRPSEQPLGVPAVVGRAPSPAQSAAGPRLVVDVEGRVRRPGLVELPDGSRVADALRAAGGVLPGTPTAALNLARKLSDGEQVLVGIIPLPASGGTANAAAGGLLDLNLASAKDLDDLPGIGPVLAERIVAWRTEHGRFASIDQLREVPGIGESKYQSLKTKVRV